MKLTFTGFVDLPDHVLHRKHVGVALISHSEIVDRAHDDILGGELPSQAVPGVMECPVDKLALSHDERWAEGDISSRLKS